MTEHPNAAIIRSAYEAVEKGDVAAYAALLDDNIIWHESTPGLIDVAGLDLEALYGGFAGEPFTDDSREYVFITRRPFSTTMP